jgi:hypothetical protein
MNEMPRRCQVELMSTAERAIAHAMRRVEAIGAHPLLTDAVILLGQAKDKVADYVDQEVEQMNEPSPNKAHRDQVADLILTSPDGKPMDILSPLESKDGTMSFIVGGQTEEGDRYKVTIAIEEV